MVTNICLLFQNRFKNIKVIIKMLEFFRITGLLKHACPKLIVRTGVAKDSKEFQNIIDKYKETILFASYIAV